MWDIIINNYNTFIIIIIINNVNIIIIIKNDNLYSANTVNSTIISRVLYNKTIMQNFTIVRNHVGK